MSSSEDPSNAVQSGVDWLTWRSKGIGSSDAPIIMGASPWKTKRQLYFEKISERHEAQAPNWAQQKGIDNEPKARALYELMSELDMPSINMENTDYPFLRASLDGYNDQHKIILEIKCPGKDDHAKAKEGRVPDKYVWQLEHQLMVSGAEVAHYFSLYLPNKNVKGEEEDHALVEYRSNPELRRKLLAAELEFWTCVQNRMPPPPGPEDSVDLEDQFSVEIYNKIRTCKQRVDLLKKQLDEAEDALELAKIPAIKVMPHTKIRCAGVELTKVEKLGSIDTKALSEIPDGEQVDLEKYRRKSTVYYTVKLTGGRK